MEQQHSGLLVVYEALTVLLEFHQGVITLQCRARGYIQVSIYLETEPFIKFNPAGRIHVFI